MLLDLSERDVRVMIDVVQRAIGEVQADLYWTELSELHRKLGEREVVLRSVLQRLSELEAAGLACSWSSTVA